MKRRDVLAFGTAALAAAALRPFPARAQGKFPERPIKLMVAFSAGGVNDVVGRQWAERMRPLLGTVFVENQGGAGGTIAVLDVARAQPDGHTLLLGSTSTLVLNPMTMPKVPYDPVKDFMPIALLAVSTTSIVVHADVPVKTIKEFVAYAKANPGKLSYGSAGTGTMSHLSGELFKLLTGLSDLVHIPYKGAGPGITDLVSGHIPAMTPNITGQVIELHRSRQDPHPVGQRRAAARGAAGDPDLDRGRRARHDRAPRARPVRAGGDAEADRRAHRRGDPQGDDRPGIPEGVRAGRARGGAGFRFGEDACVPGRGGRALGPGGEGGGPEAVSAISAPRRHAFAGHALERIAVDLVGRGERQLVDEPDEARMRIGRRVGERELLDLVLGRRVVGLRHHERDRLLALDVVVDRHHGACATSGMALQHALDVGRIDVLAAGHEHVVGAADEIVKAVGVAAQHVAGDVEAVRR